MLLYHLHQIYLYNQLNNISIYDISTKSTYKDAVINGNSTYTDEIFFKTQFFYPDLSINDGVHLDTNGSYYTNILTFDGNSGKISKRLYLNNHIEYTTRYSYSIDVVSDIIIQPDNTDLSNLSIYDYDKYYIQYGDNGNSVTERLNSSTESPAYFLSNSAYTVFTKKVSTETFDYNGIGSYQWSDYEYGGPGIIEFNDNVYVNSVFEGLRPASIGLIAAAAFEVVKISLLNIDLFEKTHNILLPTD